MFGIKKKEQEKINKEQLEKQQQQIQDNIKLLQDFVEKHDLKNKTLKYLGRDLKHNNMTMLDQSGNPSLLFNYLDDNGVIRQHSISWYEIELIDVKSKKNKTTKKKK